MSRIIFIFLDLSFSFVYAVCSMSKRLLGPNGKVIKFPLVNEKHEQKRPHLADMMAIPKKFRQSVIPVGMDGPGQTDEVIYEYTPLNTNDDPSKNEIIRTLGLAYPELVSFLKDVDELKRLYAEACGVIKEMHRAGTGKRSDPIRGVVEDVEDTRLAGARAIDVLRTIAYNIKPDSLKPQEIARRFFDEEDKRGRIET